MCDLGDVEAEFEKILSIQFLEVRDNLLIHRLQYKSCVGWKEYNFYKTKLLQNIILYSFYVGRSIIIISKAFLGRLLSRRYFLISGPAI